MKRTQITTILISSALALTACASTAGAGDDSAPRGDNTPTSEWMEEESEYSEYSEDGGYGAVMEPVRLGQTITYDDGLSITVGKPQAFTPDPEWATGGEGFAEQVKMTVTVVNNTGMPFDADMTYITVQSANVEGEEIYDDSLTSSPQTSLLDGREATYEIGYGVGDSSDLVVEVEPGSFEHESAIFTSK